MVVTHERGAENAPKKKAATKRGKRRQAEAAPVPEEAVDAGPEPEATAGSTLEPAAAPAARRGRQPTAAGASLTLAELAERYLEHLEAQGKSHGTLFSYGIELKTACKELGADTQVAGLTPEQVLAYFESPRVTRLKSGKPKAKPSIDKTRRVLRLALVWAVELGWLAVAPLPEAAESK